VCDALGSGEQSVILRKGGIHEGGGGFSFDHDQFALFPTLFHEQEQQLRTSSTIDRHSGQAVEYQPGDEVVIRFWATLGPVWNLGTWETIKKLESFHIWKSATIRERFDWSKSPAGSPGIKMALVRICRLGQPWKIKYQRNHGGCRSWLKLPEIPQALWENREPVLNEDEFSRIREGVEEIAGLPPHQLESGCTD